MDITDSATRSRMMAGIKGKDTVPELAVRKALHAYGLRFRLHAKGLPGKPDLTFPRHRAALFVHGCFWHHHGCSNSTVPKTRASFWADKLKANTLRDEKARIALLHAGWRVGIVWECSVRAERKGNNPTLYSRIARWIRSGTDDEASF